MNNTENNQGWIKLHRKILDSTVYTSGDAHLFQLWIYILLKVNHKKSRFLFNGEEITIKPGSGVFGLNQIVKDLTGLKNENKPKFKKYRSIYFRRLKLLQNMKNIELKPTNKFTVITVVNWDQYQQNETQVKLKRNSSETQVKTNKNDKNVKNEKNILPKGKEQVQIDNRDQRVDELIGLIHKELGVKLIGKYQKERLIYSNAIKLLTRKDGKGNIKKGREWLSDDWKLNFKNFIDKLALNNPKVISNIQWADTLYKQLKFYIENHGQF